jgi:hypothetical protein
MKTLVAMTAAAALLGATATSMAQDKSNQGASKYAPGQQMQDKGSKPGTTGASGYAPGQKMQDKGAKPGTTGASGYAPGQRKKDDDANKSR